MSIKSFYNPKHLRKYSWKIPLFIFILLIIVSLLTGYFYYSSLNAQVKTESTQEFMPKKDRPDTTNATDFDGKNYLLIGSDSESGKTQQLQDSRSDTTVIVNFSQDGQTMNLVSIPRDSMVKIPKCRLEDDTWTKPESPAIFNSAFTRGDSQRASIACTMRTIEHNTNVPLAGFMIVDFTGFEQIVDTLGGITIDVPRQMKSKNAHLNIKPGKQTLDGETALAYSRARTFEVGGGNGSDLDRIERQQQVMQAIAKKASKVNPLENPVKFNKTAERFLESMTVSEDLNSLSKLYPFAQRLQKGQDDMNFATVPNETYPDDPDRVQWTPEAKAYWDSLIHDKPLPE